MSRRSVFALYRNAEPFKPRNQRDPASGLVEAQYLLVKHTDGLGGYGEIALQGGQPRALTSFEIDIQGAVGGDFRGGRRRGTRESIDALIDRVAEEFRRITPERPAEFDTTPSPDQSILDDRDFWPRVFVDPRGVLRVRSRDPADEGVTFVKVLHHVITNAEAALRDHSRWRAGEVPAGATHLVQVAWEPESVLRVIAKIAYGVAWNVAGPTVMAVDPLQMARLYAKGAMIDPHPHPVTEVVDAGGLQDWPAEHVACVYTTGKGVFGIVSLYGSCFEVNLMAAAPNPNPWKEPAVFVCDRSGRGISRENPGRSVETLQRLRQIVADAPR